MKNVVITKDFGTGKANAQAKVELTEIIMNALITEFGEENVAMIRTGGTSQVNEIGVRIGTITDADGFTYDFCATVNPTIKGFKERVTKRYTVEAFDFETAKQAYVDDVTAKTQEKEANAKAKAEKIERDKKAREEKKLANTKEKETETTAK
jgi:hypothetical protein